MDRTQRPKRKKAPTNASGSAPKRSKIFGRSILAQASDKALNANGELDVGAFVKAREKEIIDLQERMAGSKRRLATRAFQQVPRGLRRRTASHNVKRVPKRLQARAAKEVQMLRICICWSHRVTTTDR